MRAKATLIMMLALAAGCTGPAERTTPARGVDEAICASAVRLRAFLSEQQDPRQAGRTLLQQIVGQAPKARIAAVREAAGARGLTQDVDIRAFANAVEHLTETCGQNEPDVSVCTAARGWLEKAASGEDPEGASTLIRLVIRFAATVRKAQIATVARQTADEATALASGSGDEAKRFERLSVVVGRLATACDDVYLKR